MQRFIALENPCLSSYCDYHLYYYLKRSRQLVSFMHYRFLLLLVIEFVQFNRGEEEIQVIYFRRNLGGFTIEFIYILGTYDCYLQFDARFTRHRRRRDLPPSQISGVFLFKTHSYFSLKFQKHPSIPKLSISAPKIGKTLPNSKIGVSLLNKEVLQARLSFTQHIPVGGTN